MAPLPPAPLSPLGRGGRLTGVRFSIDGVPTRSVGTGFCLSVGTCSASGRHADAQKRVPTEKPTPARVGGWGIIAGQSRLVQKPTRFKQSLINPEQKENRL